MAKLEFDKIIRDIVPTRQFCKITGLTYSSVAVKATKNYILLSIKLSTKLHQKQRYRQSSRDYKTLYKISAKHGR